MPFYGWMVFQRADVLHLADSVSGPVFNPSGRALLDLERTGDACHTVVSSNSPAGFYN